MNPLLEDLLDHQAWADAEHWRALELYAPAREDRAIHDRLHHIHQVQRLFIWAVGERQTEFAFSNYVCMPKLNWNGRTQGNASHPLASATASDSQTALHRHHKLNAMTIMRGSSLVPPQSSRPARQWHQEWDVSSSLAWATPHE
jgi:hypothetical protein